MQTGNKTKTPKIICGIIATISMTVIGFFSLSAFWFWTGVEIISGLLVAGGCWGEWYLFKNPPDEGDESQKLHHRGTELQCIIAVAIGVTMELLALSHSIKEGVQLEKDVANIGTTNAQLSLQIETLRSNNIELQLKLQPRVITEEQYSNFIKSCEGLPHIPIKVFIGMYDVETINYAQQIRKMLDDAGFKSDEFWEKPELGWKQDGIITLRGFYIERRIYNTRDYGSLMLFKNDTNVIVKSREIVHPPVGRVFISTNSKNQIPSYFFSRTNDSVAAVCIISRFFSEVGINGIWLPDNMTNILKEGEAAVFVPPKFN